MKGVKLFFENNLPYGSAVFADGKEVKVDRFKNGRSEAFVETEKEEVEISITNPIEGQLPFLRWLIRTVICWLISVFGIFDRVENSSCRIADVKFSVKAAENACLTLKFNPYRKDTPVALIAGDADFTEITNDFYVDEKAKKRVKFYKIWRTLFIFAAAIITAIIIFSRR